MNGNGRVFSLTIGGSIETSVETSVETLVWPEPELSPSCLPLIPPSSEICRSWDSIFYYPRPHRRGAFEKFESSKLLFFLPPGS